MSGYGRRSGGRSVLGRGLLCVANALMAVRDVTAGRAGWAAFSAFVAGGLLVFVFIDLTDRDRKASI